MSIRLCSPSRAIEGLSLNRIPTNRKIEGEIYASGSIVVIKAGVNKNVFYVAGIGRKDAYYLIGDYHWLPALLKCLLKLKIISKEDVERHNVAVGNWKAKQTANDDADALKRILKRQNLKPNKEIRVFIG